jgi:plasmid stabilization system protein ParE
MRVRWTTDAADDLERICDYVAERRPESARRVAQSVVERIGTLEEFSHLGRSGRVEGTREISASNGTRLCGLIHGAARGVGRFDCATYRPR